MTNSISKIKALKDAIGLTKSVSGTINSIVEMVNHAWTHCGEPYPLPVGEYKRRAWLLADLERMLAQLVDEAHDEALEEYDARNTLYVYAPGDAAREVWDQMTPIEQTTSVELRHAEALEMNRLFNMRAASDDRPQRLAKETGFPVLTCLKELIAEEGNYFAALERLRQIVSDAHSEALRDNELLDTSALVVLNNRDAWKSASATVKKLAVSLAHSEAQKEDYRFNWLHNRWCMFHSSSRLQQEEIIAVAWEQARQTIEDEEEYNAQKKWKLEAIWKHTHRDYKGEQDGVRSILVCRNGTISVPLESLTDKEIEQRSPMWQRNK
jgi:hypothetical protein